MLRKLLILVVVLAAVGAAVFWIVTMPATVSASALGPHTPDLGNGKTMFYAGGCAACHATPNQEDKTRLGGGLALKSPFGTFHVPNISSDRDDGIGGWDEAQFVTAILKGSADGDHLYPAFPYSSYAHMRIEDVRDLFAFLKTLPAVKSSVPDHDLKFPFNIRRATGMWKLVFVDETPFRPDPGKSAEWNRGAYLVNAPGHCAECHSPRNLLGGIVKSQRFAGGPNPAGDGWIPNITQKGLADYTVADLLEILTTGTMPNGDSVGGEMAEVVRSTEKLPEADRKAMAVYIKSLPPVEGPKPPPKKEEQK